MKEARSATARRSEFERVALPHLDGLFTAASYLTRDPDRARDLVQTAMLRAFRFFDRFEAGTNCRAWLLTILYNAFRNRYRSERREGTRADIDDPEIAADAALAAAGNPSPESVLVSRSLDQEVAQALEALPEDFRAAIVLVDLEDLTYEEAARALDCPIGTVRSRLSRGRAMLAANLSAYAEQLGYRKAT